MKCSCGGDMVLVERYIKVEDKKILVIMYQYCLWIFSQQLE